MTSDDRVENSSGWESHQGKTTSEKRSQETTEKLRQLHDVTREMMAADTKQTLLRTVTEAATELLGFEFNTVRRVDRERLVPVAASAPLRSEDGDRAIYERGESVQWRAIDERKIQIFQNVGEIDDGAERTGEGSMLIVPLSGYGVLSMGTPECQGIDEKDVELARVFGANIETAIERVERLETLNRREKELTQRTQQIAVLNRGLRHNIRNELNLLIGWLTSLEGDLSDEQRACVEQSLEAANNINSLAKKARNIQEMLGDDPEISEQDLVTSTQSKLERARREYPDASFDAELPASAEVLAIDRVGEAIWEGIENAIVHNDSEQPRVSVRIERVDTGTVRQQLTIADNGPGIPRQERHVLSTEHENKLKHGSGLGLWYLKWVVDRSSGELDFTESRFETGTALKMQFQTPSVPPESG